MPEKESKFAPWMPRVSKGARMVLEQFLCALAQEATHNAHIIKKGCGSSARINKRHMQLAWNVTQEKVFGGSELLNKHVVCLPLPSSKAASKASGAGGKSKKESSKRAASNDDDDEEYSPPMDDASTSPSAKGNVDDLTPED